MPRKPARTGRGVLTSRRSRCGTNAGASCFIGARRSPTPNDSYVTFCLALEPSSRLRLQVVVLYYAAVFSSVRAAMRSR